MDTVEDGVGRGDKRSIICRLAKVLNVALALDKTALFSDCIWEQVNMKVDCFLST